MLDSERTYRIKVRSGWTVFAISLTSAVICIQKVLLGKETFKTTNITKLTKVFLESSYRVPKVTFKWKTLKQPVYF